MSDQPEPRPRPCPLPGFGDKCIRILQQSRFRWLTRIAAESSVRGNQDIIPMTCDVLRIFRADTLMRSTTMATHDSVFIVRITGPIISSESQAIAGDHIYFPRRGICHVTYIEGGPTWSR